MRKTRVYRSLANTPLIASLLLVASLSIVFAFRYKPAFSSPNFYAEDGTVFINNIIQHGVLEATFTTFNGYLVVGQYLVADVAYGLYLLFGLQFSHLPSMVAMASCLFLGLTASLPFILFRKELGWVTALITSLILAFTPLYGSDYAIIGTIGNLKFAFLFWAVVFIVYRNIHYQNTKRVVAADGVLLLCVLTNGPIVALLPFILWPYRRYAIGLVRERRVTHELLKRRDFQSAALLLGISAVYVAIVYIKGIPVIPNYLNSPYVWTATDNIIYRVTGYGIFFPFSEKMTAVISIATLAILLLLALLLNKRRRSVFVFGLYAIAVSTVAFIITRPGIGEHMLIYEKFPDQFFYAQSMIFVFILMWVAAPYLKNRKVLTICMAGLFLLLSSPYGSSYGANQAVYKERPVIYDSVSLACRNSNKKEALLQIYPNATWNMQLESNIVCK